MTRLASNVLKSEPGSYTHGSLAWHQHHQPHVRLRNRSRPGSTAAENGQPVAQIITSGMSTLDDLLPGGGWRKSAITEILSDINENAALDLILPALVTLSQEKKWLCFVGPPQFLDRFKLANAGIDVSRVLLVHPRASTNGLWLVEQVLRAGTCSAVLTWMTGGNASVAYNVVLDNAGISGRLQLAAEAGGSMGFVFRDPSYASQDSPVATRLLLKKQQQKIQLQVLKSHNTKFAEPRVLKFSVNRLSRQNYHHQDQNSQNHGNRNSILKNQQLSLY